MAFGGVLLFEVENQDDANDRLAALLPSINLDSQGTAGVSDLLFRINRRRFLAFAGGEALVNRISTWSTVQIGSVGFTISGGGPVQVVDQTGSFACRLELDVNTAGNFTHQLGGGEAVEVFGKLVGLSQEIAAQGDVP